LASSNRAIVDVRQRADSWIAEAYRTGVVAKQRQKSGSLTKTIDHLEWMREQMLTLQRALERVESDKHGRQIQKPTTRLKIKQF
jgi:ubiquinone biosynthesis protein Coq4